jgi:ATP-dependent helicase/nuclease subunit A
MTTILSLVPLTRDQADAVTAAANVAVTAGAGSGKTRTLVARYLELLQAGRPLRSLVAITFTDKAAREMRSRIRQTIQSWLARQDAPDRDVWQETFASLDAARIGTVHSLCAEILRAHPAEAGLDPAFDVLDENQAALYRARAVEAALAWAANDPAAARLFGPLTEYQLRQAVSALLSQRLDAAVALDAQGDAPLAAWQQAVAQAVAACLDAPDVQAALAELADLRAGDRLLDDAGDKLAPVVEALLAAWREVQAARANDDWETVLAALYRLRRSGLPGNVGKKGRAKEAVAALRATYDATLQLWLGGQNSGDKPAGWAMDRLAADLLPELRRLFDRALEAYNRLKADQEALDFDDLESLAARLLTENAAVRARWQQQVRAVLVDEFQDTNERQRQIVYTLADFPPLHPGERGSGGEGNTLFIVGDAKQSIYRFRGADVAVFRHTQNDVTAAGGRHVDLDLTFRAHGRLVDATNALLAPILGQSDDPARPYEVPFAPLRAHRQAPRDGVAPPFVEFHLGIGETADEGRRATADALALRLRALNEAEGVDWGDVALLFRASTAFPVYEDALERTGIPFVTVAGRGFYGRPEVRDLINALTAIADPTDDLALAGLLRSPAFGLTDAALYLLRWGEGDARRSMWDALHGDLSPLDESDARRAAFARQTIARLHGLAGRAPVAQALKSLLDATHYRAVLRLAPGGDRLQRNVDKLLADAHHSGLVSVSEFVEYVAALREAAAREGEAPIEAGGAVQLMTVHKAKGLEFPVVVVADAARRERIQSDAVIVEPKEGVALDLLDRQSETRPAHHRLAALRQAAMDEAESKRLLYVAATRAKEKLLVSGHTRRKKDGSLTLDGWLGWLGAPIGLDQVRLDAPPPAAQPAPLTWPDGDLVCILYPPRPEPLSAEMVELAAVLESGERPVAAAPREPVALLPPDLLAPVHRPPADDADDKTREQEKDPPEREWRVVPQPGQGPPARVVGKLTHVALAHWRFPDRPDFEVFLFPYALEAGLTDHGEITAAMSETRQLLARFQQDSLYAELNAAERHHELPYSVELATGTHGGILDLLCRVEGRWTVVEFKTDELRHSGDLRAHITKEKYDRQVARYVEAVHRLLGERPRALLVFLNVGRRVCVEDLSDEPGVAS